MRKLLFALPAALLFLASCGGSSNNNATEAQTAAEHKGETFLVDTNATVVDWKGAHKGGLAPRWGKIKVSAGTISIHNDSISGGDFIINMSSLNVDPASVAKEEGKSPADLEGHLKSADFFDVEKAPTAKFEITKVEAYTAAAGETLTPGANYLISGNLTLKDKTLNVSFPAKVDITATGVTAAAKFVIDRSAWGISYKTEGSPADWMISKDVEVGFNLNATK